MSVRKRVNEFVKNNRFLKWVPNILTLCNSLCGFAAVLYTLRAYELSNYQQMQAINVFAISAWIIFFAMIFDAMDGFAARLFNAASMHGIQMDSLSDMVTFGLAPATLVAIMTHFLRDWSLDRTQEIIVYLLCSIYLGCAALRLATYNVHAMLEKKSGDKFSGLPSPGAASAICVVVLFARHAQIDIRFLSYMLPIYAAFLGLLMVSKIPYTHMGKWLMSVKRNPRRMLMLVAVLFTVALFKVEALTFWVTGYILWGPVVWLWQLVFKHKTA